MSDTLKQGDLIWVWPYDEPEPLPGLLVDVTNRGGSGGDVWSVQTVNGIERVREPQIWRRKEDCEQDSFGGFSNAAFPLVRRVFGNMIAQDLVSVQPMTMPAGTIFQLPTTDEEDEE